MQNLFGKSRYLTKDDVGEKGAVFTIAGIKTENIGKSGDRNPEMGNVLYFVECKKGMVLKPTNAKQIAKQLGIMDPHAIEQGAWNGYQVCLYNNPNIVFGNDVTGGIRVRTVTAYDEPFVDGGGFDQYQEEAPTQPAGFRPDPRQGPAHGYQQPQQHRPPAPQPQHRPPAPYPQQQRPPAPQPQQQRPPAPPRPPGAPVYPVNPTAEPAPWPTDDAPSFGSDNDGAL